MPLAIAWHFPGKGNDTERYWPENPPLDTQGVHGWRWEQRLERSCRETKTKGAAKPKQTVSLNVSFLEECRLIKTELKVSL